jgi:hypothetical protein
MEENKFKCNECKKYYKSYQSLWHHKNRFHSIITQNTSIQPQNTSIQPQNTSKISINKLLCEYCNKIYSRIDNLNRHKKKCKSKEILISQNDEIIKQQDEIIKQNNELIRQNEELSKKLDLINTTNKTNTNNGTINNTSNSNNTITNNINIFRLGCETILENLPTEEVLYILRLEKYKPLLEAIRKTHFDKDHPEGHNWYNSNLRENFVTVYNKDINKSIRDNKEETTDYVLQQRINELEELSYKHKDELTKEQMNNIDNIVKNDCPPYISEKVKTMAYQNKDIVIKTINKVIK